MSDTCTAATVIEVFSGFGLGGAERSIAARLARSPEGIETIFVNIGKPVGPMRDEIASLARIFDIGPYSIRRLRDLIRTEQPDLVLSHTPRAAIMAAAATAGARPQRHRRPKLVTVVHLTVISERRWKRVVQSVPLWWANRRNDLTVAVSAAAGRSEWARGSRHVVVLPLGAELIGRAEDLAWAEFWSPRACLRWIALARLSPAKNLEGLIAAVGALAPQLRNAGVELILVGDGPSARSVDTAIEVEGVADLVMRCPATLTPGPLLETADALIIASIEEGGPLTAIEALLAGTRVLSTPVGLVPELFAEANDDGLIMVPGHRRDDLVAGLERLLALGACTSAERTTRRTQFESLHVDHASQRFVDQLLSLRAE